MDYIDRLIENCHLAKTSIPVQEFEYKSMDNLDGIKQAIYIIEEIELV